jgi:hypothetical protein
MSPPEKYYGKYRGTVANNLDPMQKGRIQVVVTDVSNIALSSWAMPCVPISGLQSGMFVLPPVGAGVWVEFEHGDPDYPIWVGGWWGSAVEIPAIALAGPAATPNAVLQTVGQNAITLFGAPGAGVALSAGPVFSPTSPRLVIAQSGILLSNGLATITLVGSTVDINLGALTIT